MIKNWKEFKMINEAWEEAGKDEFWNANYDKLIEIAIGYPYENWLVLCDNDTEQADAMMEQSRKHMALGLMHFLSLEDLKDLIEEYEEY